VIGPPARQGAVAGAATRETWSMAGRNRAPASRNTSEGRGVRTFGQRPWRFALGPTIKSIEISSTACDFGDPSARVPCGCSRNHSDLLVDYSGASGIMPSSTSIRTPTRVQYLWAAPAPPPAPNRPKAAKPVRVGERRRRSTAWRRRRGWTNILRFQTDFPGARRAPAFFSSATTASTGPHPGGNRLPI